MMLREFGAKPFMYTMVKVGKPEVVGEATACTVLAEDRWNESLDKQTQRSSCVRMDLRLYCWFREQLSLKVLCHPGCGAPARAEN